MIEGSPYPVYLVSGDELIITLANRATLEAWGRDMSVIGKRFNEALPELHDQPFESLIRQVMRSGEPYHALNDRADIMINEELQTYFYNFSYQPLFGEEGETIGVVCYATNVTEQENARLSEIKLRHSTDLAQMQRKLAIEGARLATWSIDPETKIGHYSPVLNEMLGHSGAVPLTYQEQLAQISPEFRQQVVDAIAHTIRTGEDYDVTYSQRRLDTGELVWLRALGRPVKNEEMSISLISGVIMDVTLQVRATQEIQQLHEEARESNEELAVINEEMSASNEELTESYHLLELSEGRFRNIIVQAPFAICVIRAEDLIVSEVNDRYLELVGKKRVELEGKNIWDGVPEAAEVYEPVMQQVIRRAVAFHAKEAELYLLRQGKPTQVFVDFVYEPVCDTKGEVSAIMVVGIDVSEKVLARQAVEEMEERIRLAVEAAEMGTFDYDYGTQELLGSERFYEIFGVPIGSSREEVINTYHPEDRSLSAEAHERAKTSGKILYEARLMSGAGSMRWVRFQSNVYFDGGGNPVRTLGTVLDITEFKALQQQKDDFISIASHELKTPLTSLKASLQLLERMKDQPNPLSFPRLITQAAKSMDKISELVDDLLNVSRINEGQMLIRKDWFDIDDLLHSCCATFRENSGKQFPIQTTAGLKVFADEHRIEQVLVNLISNAIKYAPESAVINLIAVQISSSVKVEVRDNGPGISQEKIPHLFDRYYRGDSSGIQVSGLGLGLYISADIVRRHGGEIGVESRLNEGSTFWFTLPNPQ
ncbi:PAS domain-containing protein [Pedobacter sp. BAL39]|uniref:PAS domain-containing sensor histidine kinase n=1 Tax=Pedobacter sp. BAL39 TaxID=391596 RepID=UPI0018DC3387|nr:PAS domain-containing protein [Pedobacter sp. BAL39]